MEKNKTGKYLKYAIGEIVLVVVGILIALSINNWNDNRKNNNLKQAYVKNLIFDLEKDLEKLKQLQNQNTNYENAGLYILDFMNNELPKIDTLTLAESLVYCSYIPNFTITATTYNDIINGNNINLFKDVKLKRLLESHYAPNEWGTLFNDRILKTAWYDYKDEIVKYISALLYRDIYEIGGGFNDNRLNDSIDYNINWEQIKTNHYLKTQVEIITSYRVLIRSRLNGKIKSAKSLLEYFELNP
jgi:hypothetical protein